MPAHNRYEPQETNQQERQEVDKQIPTAKSRRGDLNCSQCFSAALCALQTNPDPPKFVGIKRDQRFVLNLTAEVFTLCRIECFSEPSAGRLYADLNFQITGDSAVRECVYNDEESACADIRISPNRDHARADFLIHNYGEWRTVMRAGRRGNQEQDQCQCLMPA